MINKLKNDCRTVDQETEKLLNKSTEEVNSETKELLEVNSDEHNDEIDKTNIDFPENGVFIVLSYIFIEQNKCFRNKDKSWYFYEPSIDARRVNNYTDSWYNLNGEWKKSETYNISMELTLTN